MKGYYRIYLGKGNCFVKKGFDEGFIGVDFGFKRNLSEPLSKAKAINAWRTFNHSMIPEFLDAYPEKSKVAAGLACGMTYTVGAHINEGDIVLMPDGNGSYYVGEVTGDYTYAPDEILPHRRPVRWRTDPISREVMSENLKKSLNSSATVIYISQYADEIEHIIEDVKPVRLIANQEEIENPSQFVLEKHLEDFLVENWRQTELGKKYDIFADNGEIIGQQYASDTGPIDILAISKDNKEILVIELKKGRASDVVVGQIQRYMGYVQSELAEPNQVVRGIIIAFEKDLRLERALSVTNNIDFYEYEVSFRLKSYNKN
jgi:restriction system protein